MNRMNSSAVARWPRERRAATSMRTATRRDGNPEGDAGGRALRQQQCLCSVMGSHRSHCHGERAPMSGSLRWALMIRCPGVVERCADTGGLVPDPDEHPDKEEAGVQRTVRLRQSADREVVLVRPRVDAEDLPGHHHDDQHQPGHHAPECRPAAATAPPGPRLVHGCQVPCRWPSRPPAPQCEVDQKSPRPR